MIYSDRETKLNEKIEWRESFDEAEAKKKKKLGTFN